MIIIDETRARQSQPANSAHMRPQVASIGMSGAHALNHFIILLELRNEALSKRVASDRPVYERRLCELSAKCLEAADETVATMFSVGATVLVAWIAGGMTQEKFEELTDPAGDSPLQTLRVKGALALRRFALASKLLERNNAFCRSPAMQ